jgi:Arc/MetJ-type ribon-helix-helix transcriptional regulator
MAVGDSEKVSINCGAVDLGQIDLLVEQGLYSNRSDFFRTAIRNQLRTHESFIQHNLTSRMMALGVVGYSRADLEELVAANQRLSVRMIGVVYFQPDVTPELARAAVESVRVYGILRASNEVKAALRDRILG